VSKEESQICRRHSKAQGFRKEQGKAHQVTIDNYGMVAAVQTRQIGLLTKNKGPEGHAELDSHTDTCAVGDDTALVIKDFEHPVSVVGYDRTVGAAKQCKTMSAVIAYDHPRMGQGFMLIIHQALLIPKIHYNLLGTIQT